MIEGIDGRDWQVQSASIETIPQHSLKNYRFAWTDDFGSVPVTADTQAILERLAIQLEGTGCRVERCSPPGFDFATALQTYDEIVDTELGVLEPSLQTLILHLLEPVSGLLPGSLA